MLTQDEAIIIQLGLIAKALQIVGKKRRDYSGKDDPFRNLRLSDLLGVHPIVGCLIRESDKNSRIASLVADVELAKAGGRVGEALLDTFADKINYTGIEAGLWAEEDPVFKEELLKLGAELWDVLTPYLHYLTEGH